jgi:heme/copper-type cytochrome/quinol oxidase subunit 1
MAIRFVLFGKALEERGYHVVVWLWLLLVLVSSSIWVHHVISRNAELGVKLYVACNFTSRVCICRENEQGKV